MKTNYVFLIFALKGENFYGLNIVDYSKNIPSGDQKMSTCNIRDFSAIGDGVTNDTSGILKAINTCAAGVGGDVVLMQSEVGVAGASSVGLINKYKGEFDALPANQDNPLWNRFNWWIEWNDYLKEHQAKVPVTLDEYVTWSQDRQTKGLTIALKASKMRFPTCGGLIIWMGHDSYPCTANTSIIDFDGNPKPAIYELSKIWKTDYTGK